MSVTASAFCCSYFPYLHPHYPALPNPPSRLSAWTILYIRTQNLPLWIESCQTVFVIVCQSLICLYCRECVRTITFFAVLGFSGWGVDVVCCDVVYMSICLCFEIKKYIPDVALCHVLESIKIHFETDIGQCVVLFSSPSIGFVFSSGSQGEIELQNYIKLLLS